MLKKQPYSRGFIAILAVLLVLQTVFLVYFGCLKQGFHEDETATYTLSNYEVGFICRTQSLLDNWISGSELSAALTAEGGERFDYSMVYANQESDVHPPLFYFLFHTIASLFPGRFSKWTGLVPNILFCLLTGAVLFLTAEKLTKNKWLALIAAAGWAFSIGAVDTATFLRMYAMLTFLVTLFVFLHVKALDGITAGRSLPVSILLLLYVCTVLGLLTQYYFSVFALFLCAFFLLFLLLVRRWKAALFYCLAEFGAILTAVLCYPAAILHITGGYRGQEAFQNLLDPVGYVSKLGQVFSLISCDLFNGWALELTALCLLPAAVVLLKKRYRAPKRTLQAAFEPDAGIVELRLTPRPAETGKALRFSVGTGVIGCLVPVLLLYVLLIAKVAPYRSDRYYMCIYPLLVLCAVCAAHKAIGLLLRSSAAQTALLAAAVLLVTVFGLIGQTPGYLYPDTAVRTAALAPYADAPAIVLNQRYDWYVTRRLPELGVHPEVYLCSFPGMPEHIACAAESKDLSDGFLLYALSLPQSDEALLAEVNSVVPLAEAVALCSGGDRVFFCIPE